MRGWVVVLMTLSGCRFGFSEVSSAPDADIPVDAAPPMPGSARVTVVGEEGEPFAGQPVSGAFVVVVEASGATVTARTAADGTATVPILGSSSIHVARPAPDLGTGHWMLYTFTGLNGDPEILVGGRAAAPVAPMTMTASLPTFTAVEMTDSRVRGPARCLDVEQPSTAGTTTTFTFAPRCANEKVELYAQALASNDAWAWIALGTTVLTNNGSITAPTSWQDNQKYDVDYTGLPSSIAKVWGVLAFPGGPSGSAGWSDAIILDDDVTTVDLGDARLVYDGPPIIAGTKLVTFFQDPTAAVERRVVERVDAPFGNRIFDNALIGPDVTVPLADGASRTVSWASSGLGAADFVAVDTTVTTGGAVVTWKAYGPASATSLTYPTLPSELAAIVAVPTASWTTPTVQIVTLSDFTYATALPILDRDLYWWQDVGAYLPSGTLAVSTARATTSGRPAPTRLGGAGREASPRAHRPPSTARR